MSSQENEARKQLRTGIRGEYEMRPLDEFRVTTTARVEEQAPQLTEDERSALLKQFIEAANRIPPLSTADILWPKDELEPIVVACWEATEQHLLDMQRDWTGSMLAQFLGVLGTIPPLPETGCPPEFVHVLYWQKAMEELFL